MAKRNPHLPVSKAKTAYGLLSEIRKLILDEPKRYFQWTWRIDERSMSAKEMPSCGTVGCVAGWVDVLKSSRPIPVADAWNDGALFIKRGRRVLGISQDQASGLFYAGAAGNRSVIDVVRHARLGAAHIARFQKKYAAQLKAKRV